MRTHLKTAMLAFLLAAGATSLSGQILDRIAAVVDGRIITESDIRREREYRAFALGNSDDGDGGGDSSILEALIERRLVEDQIAQFREIEVSDEEIERAAAQFPEADSAAFSGDLRAIVAAEIRRAKYFDLRFRQFIRAADAEVEAYYQTDFLPAARSAGLDPPPPLDEVRELIRNQVIDLKLNDEVEVWLAAIRRRAEVEIFP